MDEVIIFLNNNKKHYSEYFKKNRISKCKYGYTCDINQIYCHLNLINIKDTEYYAFYKIIRQYFDLKGKNILEVGCGKIPILSSIIKNNNYNIEAMDNYILIKNYHKIITTEKDLSKKFNVNKYDLIVGLRPCTPTENIIDVCMKNNKDFIIYLCSCIHSPIDNSKQFNNYKEWINYLNNKISNTKNYDIFFVTDNSLPDNCPIIIGKHNNQK